MASNDRIRTVHRLRLTLISAAVSSCFASGTAIANPTGANVVRGTAAIHQAGNLLQITNSPSAVINWQSFSIQANEITRFIQQSPSSAVLNRVTTQNPSEILGSLQSKLLDGVTTGGRVFLINPNGILFGAGAQIDVGGLVASTLRMSDEDFLAGRMRFSDGLGNSLVNQGSITTPAGGYVYLVGPAVTNSGIITSPRGEVVLAAGNTVELVNPGTPNLRVEITAPDNQAVNLGQIFADSGRVGIYAGLINQSGVVQANTAVATEDGRIVLKATNSANLATGSVTTATGPLEIEAGEILVSGNATSGPQTINAGGGLIVQGSAAGAAQLTASGGQTINAGYIEVTAQEGGAQIFNGFTGDQIITITGANAGGESLAIRNLGGTGVPASIMQNSSGRQVVNVSGKLAVEGGSAPDGQPAGVIFLGIGTNGQQVVSAEGIRLQGGSDGTSNSAFISAFNGTQEVIAGPGGITLIGGSSGTTNTASIGVSNSSQQTISSAGGLMLLGGAAGTRNFASIGQGETGGPQNVTVSGGVTLQGGPGGTSNFAQITQSNPDASQTIAVNDGGIALQGGAGGTNNAARIFGANQNITAAGNLTLISGVASGSNAIIGSAGGMATNLVLGAGGDVMLKGGGAEGVGALIGNTGTGPLQPTSIAISSGGNVILDSGTGAGARIGSSTSAPAAGGDISIQAAGDIQLNGTTQATRIRTLGNVTLSAGGSISEGPNGLIEAGTLSTTSGAGTSLTGPNQVASFNAANTAAGDIALVNSGDLVVMAANAAPGGKITVNNLAGDLSTSGSIAASGGGAADVVLAGGAVNIAHPVTASGTGNVSLAGGAITVDDTSVSAGGSVWVNGASLDVKGVSSGALIEAGNGFDANLSGDFRVRAASTGGGFGGWSAILADNGPVSISAGNVALEGGSKLGSFSTVVGESVAINTTGDLSIAGGTGLAAFGLLSSYRDINLSVGGTMRLDSGSGFGSFARVQTLYPGSTISVHFPSLGSGGFFVNDVEGRISQGLTGFFNGIRPAQLGRSLIVTYGE